MTSEFWRVYFNGVDKQKHWSVDNGPGTKEQTFKYLRIVGTMQTNTDMSKRGSLDEACAWLEGHGTLEVMGDSATLQVMIYGAWA